MTISIVVVAALITLVTYLPQYVTSCIVWNSADSASGDSHFGNKIDTYWEHFTRARVQLHFGGSESTASSYVAHRAVLFDSYFDRFVAGIIGELRLKDEGMPQSNSSRIGSKQPQNGGIPCESEKDARTIE